MSSKVRILKFAYFGLPHVGGTYSVFKYLRDGLSGHGVDLRWIGMGPWSIDENPAWRADMAFGEVVDGPPSAPEMDRAAALLDTIGEGGFDGVFVNVLADRVQTNAIRYLPRDMLRIMIVHSITPGTYAGARAIRDHVHAAVGVSERCRRDLIDQFGFDPSRTVTIPNPVDVTRLGSQARTPSPANSLRVLYLGRIDDTPKGVLWLPKIMDRLPASITLTVAGGGPDLARLKHDMRRHIDRVAFLDYVAPDRIPGLVASHDVFVMPSRFEGFGLALVEAMAGGSVPVASRIRLVTDTIVDHGENGFLFPVGDCAAAARHIETLAGDRAMLDRMSQAARLKAGESFDLGRTAASYAELLTRLSKSPPPIADPLKLDEWRMPSGLRDGLRTYLPKPVKNWLRVLREHA